MSVECIIFADEFEFPEMNFDKGMQYGLIAQELEEIVPELVETDANGYKAIDYTHIVPVLIEAIKELNTKVLGLESTVEVQNVSLLQHVNLNTELKASIERMNLRMEQIENAVSPQTTTIEK